MKHGCVGLLLILGSWLEVSPPAAAQTNLLAGDPIQERLKSLAEALRFMDETLAKGIDDLMWFRRIEELAYAGVPVSDLVARMGYTSQTDRDLLSAPYPIGKTAEENVAEYRRRSPAWQAERLQTPLLIHTATNDEDVNVLEVEHLIRALKAAGVEFEHKIYTNAPGGHQFNRLDTKLARESRAEIYRFLAKYLNPPKPPK